MSVTALRLTAAPDGAAAATEILDQCECVIARSCSVDVVFAAERDPTPDVVAQIVIARS